MSLDYDNEKKLVLKDNFIIENIIDFYQFIKTELKNNLLRTLLIFTGVIIVLILIISLFSGQSQFNINGVTASQIGIERYLTISFFKNKNYNISYPKWSPDSKFIIFTSDVNGIKNIWIAKSYGIGEPTLMTKKNNPNSWLTKDTFREENLSPAWSPIGNKIAYVNNKAGNYDIWTMDETGKVITQLTKSHLNETAPDWSPDGSKIVYQCQKDENLSLWIINEDGWKKWRITDNEHIYAAPVWSPDGKSIIFTSNKTGKFQIWKLLLDSKEGKMLQLTDSNYNKGAPAMAPDGEKIVYVAEGPKGRDLYIMNKDGSEKTNFTNTDNIDESNPAWSPTGKEILCTFKKSDESLNKLRIFILKRKENNE